MPSLRSEQRGTQTRLTRKELQVWTALEKLLMLTATLPMSRLWGRFSFRLVFWIFSIVRRELPYAKAGVVTWKQSASAWVVSLFNTDCCYMETVLLFANITVSLGGEFVLGCCYLKAVLRTVFLGGQPVMDCCGSGNSSFSPASRRWVCCVCRHFTVKKAKVFLESFKGTSGKNQGLQRNVDIGSFYDHFKSELENA